MGEGCANQWGIHMRRSVGWGGVHGVNNMDTTGTFRKESREFEGGRFGTW